MRTGIILVICIFSSFGLHAQRECASGTYAAEELSLNPGLKLTREQIELFTQNRLVAGGPLVAARGQGELLIRIPVVVHILYHEPGEDITDDMVRNQIAVLNRDFQRLNADTVNTPSYFKALGAHCPFEFVLATVDPQNRATTGIVHKYTPVRYWDKNDKIKFSSEMGDNAWDAGSYLNIWVGQLRGLEGYSSVPGDPTATDGIVMNRNAFGNRNPKTDFSMGRALVHEAGHWLGLRHLWGDADCGDDGVADTPKQRSFTSGCPGGIRVTCGSSPYGDMYMNYMDFTNDACQNLFTIGQRDRMVSLFTSGGARSSILASNGLGVPLIQEIPAAEEPPRWLEAKLYPNPATSELTVDVAYDVRWIGQQLTIFNSTGAFQMTTTITGKTNRIDISKLPPGVYFIRGAKPGEGMLERFVKMQ